MSKHGLMKDAKPEAILSALAEKGGEVTTRDFLRMTKNMGGPAWYALGDYLKVQGYIERRVVLTDKARAALRADA